jgi:signal transduction histidine kinase
LFALSSSGGTLWAAGARREILELGTGGWRREATTRPYHNEDLRMNPDGTGWVWSSTRNLLSVEFRTERGWVPIFEDRGGSCDHLLLADRDAAWIRTAKGVFRIAAPDRAPAPGPAGLPPCGDALVALSDPESGWILDGQGLHRWRRGERERILGPPGFRPTALADLGEAGLYARDDGATLWRLEPGPGIASGALDLPGFDRLRSSSVGMRGRFFGIAILEMAGRRYAYVVNHDDRNPTIDLGFESSLSYGEGAAWAELSERLGNAGERLTPSWGMRYDVAALAADLDEDGREDLVVTSNYAGVQILRNVRDDHFVDWTREAGVVLQAEAQPSGSCLIDAEGDGDLDLYVADLLGPDALFLNRGGATFERTGPESGIATKDGSSMPLCLDLDGDGDTDVAVPTFGRGIAIHENVAGVGSRAQFVTRWLDAEGVEAGSGAPLSTFNASSLAAGDIDADGDVDLFVAGATACDRLLRNEGGLVFRRAEDVLPPDAPCLGSIGADFLDADHDGDLDLAVTGRGGSRLYRNATGRYTWEHDVGVPPEQADAFPRTTGSAVVDFDDDGDLDLIHAADGWAVGFHRNAVGGAHSVVVRVDGPGRNRSAVGARVELRRAATPPGSGPLVATRFVSSGSGYGSHSDKRAHFGADPDASYDVVVSMPGAAPAVSALVRAPYRGSIALVSNRADDDLSIARFFADPWHRVWAWLTVVAMLLALGATGWIYRRERSRGWAWAIPAGAPVLSVAALAALPLDPGRAEAFVPPSLGAALSAGALAASRRFKRPVPEPEVLTELSMALRTFAHNQEPRRAFDNLRFVLANPGEGFGAGSDRAAILAEDLRTFRRVALPELGAIARLAAATPCADPRLTRAVAILERATAPGELGEALGAAFEAIGAMRPQLDRLLSVPFRRCVEMWVTSRRPLAGVPLEWVAPDGPDVLVRALPVELDRMLDVLLDNAREAMRGSDGARVRVEASWNGDGWARLRFRDSGPGVPEAIVSRIFEPGVSGRGGGGFGLHFLHRAMSRCGGRASLERPPGGACFLLEFETVPEEVA